MRTPEICKLFLEELLGKEIDHIEYVDTQKEMKDSYLHHGIRIDVYLHDEARTVYAIEMQNALKKDLEKRVRYYQGTMDRTELLKGGFYSDLSESFIILVCDFDYFGTGLAVNERVSYLKGTDQAYEDGSHVIFLNSRYKTGNAGLAITEYLDYIRTNDESREYTTELLHKTVEKVQEVRSDDKMEVSYMMWQVKFQDAREEGRAEGRAEGRVCLLSRHWPQRVFRKQSAPILKRCFSRTLDGRSVDISIEKVIKAKKRRLSLSNTGEPALFCMYCEQAASTKIRIMSAQGRREEDEMTDHQTKYLSEVGRRLRTFSPCCVPPVSRATPVRWTSPAAR